MAALYSSLATLAGSGILAMAGFFMGTRVGKETRDRAMMREKYSELYQHFYDLVERAEKFEPKTWSSFSKLPHQEPPVFALKRSGEDSLFPERLVALMTEAEKALLVAGWKLDSIKEKITDLSLEKFAAFGATKITPGSGSSNLVEPKRIMRLSDEECRCAAASILKSDAPTITMSGHKMLDGLRIEKANLSEESLLQFFIDLKSAYSSDPEIDGAIAELQGAIAKAQPVLKELKARIREPHHFRETVNSALSDPLRKRA
ncbi:hypothetical protein [Paracoccus rhizosphaerae]|uniref:Uncharacterized protein n=1 Tax=Paracoccus rhizosphaerae TaxID=1133347 RepID=A0ABV6CEA9_9RHOB|nr:hypothetical protein [Paracoccus rhizosphaerae]